MPQAGYRRSPSRSASRTQRICLDAGDIQALVVPVVSGLIHTQDPTVGQGTQVAVPRRAVVQQLSALAAAADEVSLLILKDHIQGCVAGAIRDNSGEEQIKELVDTIRQAIRR